MYFIAGVTGIAAGFSLWFITSPWVASSILWAESRYPHLIGTKSFRAGEIIICGLQVLAAAALALWVARLITG
ncbi:MAG TPA: hypothetical protein VJZ26_08185 [Blastocatellia bacterium]|nr:hypothetical protein [Blastocatellia bacterium]